MRAPTLALLALLAPPLAAGNVLVVGPSGFPSVQAAVDAAAEGDTILLTSNSEGFTIDGKSLRIFSSGAPFFVFEFPPPGEAIVTVRNLGPGQTVVLRGLDVITEQTHADAWAIRLEDNLGAVWIEDCSADMFHPFITATANQHGLRVEDCASVVIVDSLVRGARGSHGLAAESSAVFAWGSVFRGGPGISAGFPAQSLDGGHGASLTDASLFASGCDLRGGDGLSGIFCDPPSSDGGDGVRLEAGSPRFDSVDCALFGGAGGAAPLFCPKSGPGEDGVPLGILAGSAGSFPGVAHGVRVSSPVAEGQTIVKSFRGAPGELVFEAFSAATAPAIFVPELAGAAVLGFPYVVLFDGVLDGSGSLDVPLPIGALSPGLESVTLWVLPGFFDPLTLGFVLGAPSAAVLLDAAFAAP